jgi:acyl-CoA synthetase (AMP-forming)/AMP-acid ligase II
MGRVGAVTTNLASLLMDHPFADDEDLLHTLDRSVTAGEARAEARAVAADIAAAGVAPGQAVALQLPNSTGAVTAMFGIWLAGCVFVPVNPRSPSQEVARVLEVTGAAAELTPSGLRRLDGDRTYAQGTGFVLWTSGTTGAPKAILHRHDAYLELLDRVLGSLRPPGDAQHRPTPNLIPVSLALNAGIYNTLFGLRAGAAIVIMDRFETRTFAGLVRRFGIRSTVLPPAAITMLNDDQTVTDLAPLRYVRSITAPLSPLQARRFTDKFGAFVLNGYGQAELGEVIGWTAGDARSYPDKVGAAGRPHAGVDLKLLDPDAGGIGRLYVRPPNRAAGYAGGEDLDDRVDADGFVDTGDLARVDPEGFVWIEGRAGDVINRGGNKVFPDDVEEVLRLVPEVDDAAVVGVPDDRLGEVPVAFVTGRPVDAATLAAVCREHLAPYKVPVAFRHVDALPRNDAGKLLRRELAAQHRATADDAEGDRWS